MSIVPAATAAFFFFTPLYCVASLNVETSLLSVAINSAVNFDFKLVPSAPPPPPPKFLFGCSKNCGRFWSEPPWWFSPPPVATSFHVAAFVASTVLKSLWGCQCDLTVADKVFLWHVRHVEAPHVGRGHALSEGGQASPRPQPIREPRQLTVTVEVVGVQAAGRETDRFKLLCTAQ